MRRAYLKNVLRGLKRSFNRFLSILAISALGSGFLAGLVSTTPDMRQTATSDFNAHGIYDIDVKSTLGVTDEDIAALEALDAVDRVTAVRCMDFIVADGEGERYVARTYGIDPQSAVGEGADSGTVNRLTLVEGRLPEKSGECLLSFTNTYAQTHSPGDIFTVTEDNAGYEDLADTLAVTSMTVVGIVRTPLTLSIQGEISAVGSGTVAFCLYLPQSDWTLPVYTDLFVTLRGAREVDMFSDEYRAVVDDGRETVKTAGEELSELRGSELRAEAQAELDDARAEYEKKRAEAEKELARAEEDLRDAEKTLTEGEEEYEKGLAEYEKGKKEYENGAADLESGAAEAREKLERGRAEYEKGAADLAAARKELDAHAAEIADARKVIETYDTRREEIISAVAGYDAALAEYNEGVKELEKSKKQFADGEAQFEEQVSLARTALDEAKKTLDESAARIEEGRAALADAAAELETAQTRLNQASVALDALSVGQNLLKKTYDLAQKRVHTTLPLTSRQLAPLLAALDKKGVTLDEESARLASLAPRADELRARKTAGETLTTEERQFLDTYDSDTSTLSFSQASLSLGYASLDLARASQLALTGDPAGSAEALAKAGQSLDEASSVVTGIGEFIEKSRGELSAARDTLALSEKQLDEAAAALDAGNAEYEKSLVEFETQTANTEKQLDEARTAIADGEKTLAEGRAQLDANASDIADARRLIEAWEDIDGIRASVAEYDRGEAEYLEGEKKLAEARTELERGQTELEEKLSGGSRELTEAKERLDSAASELAAARRRLDDGSVEFYRGKSEYADARRDADDEFARAERELDKAQEEIDAIGGEWLLFDRRDTVGYNSFDSDVSKVEALSKVFPVFFFLVALLVCLTTMTRMVDEERTQSGVLRALGYSRGRVTVYYLAYAASASLIGGVIGFVLGSKTLPTMISNAYRMTYNMPPAMTPLRLEWAAVIILPLTAVIVVATLLAVVRTTAECPARLLLPKAPKIGRRVLLERVTFLWKRLRFTQKVTVRNLMRYKKRFYMTIIGIAGSVALLLTGFGIRDSINSIVEKQFGELYRYNLSMYLAEDVPDDALPDALSDASAVTSFARFFEENVDVSRPDARGGSAESATVLVPREGKALADYITLRDRSTQQSVPFGREGVVVSEKLAENLSLSVGDGISVSRPDGRQKVLEITGVTENYVLAYIYIAPDVWETAFPGEEVDYSLVLANVPDDTPSERDALSERLLADGNVNYLRFSSALRENFSNSVRSIDYIVYILIAASGALAVIVLYNLTNINICERRGELATIKVLGFNEREVASYIYRETTILTLIGAAVGLGLGVWLHSFVISTVEVDAVMFGRTIMPLSYLYALLLTALFTIAVDLIMLRNLRRVDMVESMKAND